MSPALVAVAHGTRNPASPGVIADLLDDVRRRLPGVDVISAWVELVDPQLTRSCPGWDGRRSSCLFSCRPAGIAVGPVGPFEYAWRCRSEHCAR